MLGLPARLTATLEMESGINDAPVIILVIMLSSGATGSPVEVVALVTYELVAGAVIGLAVAFGAAWLLRRGALPAAGLYPLSILAVAVGSYALATVAHASGFLAAYLTGLVLGNAQLPHRHATVGFVEGLAWLAQIGLFVLLGLLVSPSRLGPACWRRSASGRRCCCWPGRCRWSRPRSGSGCAGPSRCSCPGPGCAGRCRSCWRRSR